MTNYLEKQRLKAALWFAIGKMVDEESLRRNRNATPQFIGALTEMVWAQIGTLNILSTSCYDFCIQRLNHALTCLLTFM